jgi:hypothetical protein
LTTAEAANLLNAGLGIMLVQYVESESAWTPTAKKGTTNGGVAASEAERIGSPWGVTIWCDLEGVAVGSPRQQVIDYCNRWHSAVSGAGYVPGLYVGYHSGLTATQLYAKLRFTHYWGAYNLNSDEVPIVRGVQMKQSRHRPQDLVPDLQVDFQVDRITADRLGGRPTLLALEGWPELP